MGLQHFMGTQADPRDSNCSVPPNTSWLLAVLVRYLGSSGDVQGHSDFSD